VSAGKGLGPKEEMRKAPDLAYLKPLQLIISMLELGFLFSMIPPVLPCTLKRAISTWSRYVLAAPEVLIGIPDVPDLLGQLSIKSTTLDSIARDTQAVSPWTCKFLSFSAGLGR
jgi:hypothetical protein